MPAEEIHHIHLSKVGTNQVDVWIDDDKVWFSLLDEGNPQSPFFVLNKKDWEVLRKFVDSSSLRYDDIIEITPEKQELDKW